MSDQAKKNSASWVATHRYASMAPRKVRLVIDMIRGASCGEALEQLQFKHQRAARMITAVLKSAITSADENEANMQRLYVKEARVDGGPYQRRWRPKDRGRAHPINKRTSHIVVIVAER